MNKKELTNTKPLIECQDLIPSEFDFEYSGQGLTLDIQANTITHIIGPEYTGKVHWLRTLCGIEGHRHGQLKLLGINTEDLDKTSWQRTRIKIAYIPFNFALLSAANSTQNLMLAARYHKIGDQQSIEDNAIKLLHKFDPNLNLTDLPAYLRKEQQAKVAIARALFLQPDVIVLDNLFAYLDPTSRDTVLNILNQRKEQGMAIIYLSKNLDFSLQNAKKFIFTHKEFVHTFDSKQSIIDSTIPDVMKYLQKV